MIGVCFDRLYAAGEKNKIFLAGALILTSFIFGVTLTKTHQQISVWKNGVSLWQHQIKHEPQVATALLYVKLADAYMDNGEVNIEDKKTINEIEELYIKAIDIKPDYANAYWGLAKLYILKKDFQNAEKRLNQAITVNQPNPWILNTLGSFYYSLGDREKGRASFERALEISPTNELLYDRIEAFYVENKEFADDFDLRSIKVNKK